MTVGSIERGERPLRLSEAIDVASILGANLEDLIGDEDAITDLYRSNAYQRRADLARTEIRLLDLQLDLCRDADSSGVARPRVEYWTDVLSLEAIVSEELLRVLRSSDSEHDSGPMLTHAAAAWANWYRKLNGMEGSSGYGAPSDSAE